MLPIDSIAFIRAGSTGTSVNGTGYATSSTRTDASRSPGSRARHEFVDASARMGASDFRTKHLITAPVVTFSDDGARAVSETSAVVIGENIRLQLGCNGHNRFVDRLEKRDGAWRILDRKSVYDFATFTFPAGIVDIDATAVSRFPRAYAALAHLLEKSGFPVRRIFATKGSDLERDIKQTAFAWLREGKQA